MTVTVWELSTNPPRLPHGVPYYVHKGRREGSNASDPFHTVGGIGAPNQTLSNTQ